MNGLLTDPRFTAAVVLTLVALISWIARGHSRRLETLEREAVRREDLDLLREESNERHQENSGKLNNIESGIRETHGRIDDLYRDLMNNRD